MSLDTRFAYTYYNCFIPSMTTSQKQELHFGCPRCKSDDVSENDIVGVHLRVTEWAEDGEPAGFGYPWRIKDGTMARDADEPRFHCNDCGEEFEEPARLNEGPILETALGSSR